MFKTLKFLLGVFLAAHLITGCNSFHKSDDNEQPYLIILSLDGFRWDYCENANTPVLDSLAKVGSKAESLKPCFPTKTFPNHYSIATGLHPDNHGIVLNGFYANDLESSYAVRDRAAVTNGEFYGGNPIWNVAESQGITAATLFWVGASAAINNKRPSYWSLYEENLSLDSRIDSLSHWLSLPEKDRPHFIMWYYKEPDGIGHNFGPDSPEIINEVEKLDAFVGDFLTAMRKLPVFEKLNIIVLSDHGMGKISSEQEIFITELIDTNDIEYYNGGNPIINLKVKEGKLDKVYSDLIKSNREMEVWKHGEIPKEYHYGNNIRTQDITVVAKPYWSLNYYTRSYKGKGTHGYSNNFKDMHAIFFAAGPAFKADYVHPTFNNIDIYPLVGEVLNIKVPESDGNINNVIGLLRD